MEKYGVGYDCVVFDLETTGLDPERDQICEIGAVAVRDGLPCASFGTLVAIDGKMPEAASRINGITDEMLAEEGMPLAAALREFVGGLRGAVLVGHNIDSFDIPFVKAACARVGVDFPDLPTFDTLTVARELWPELPRHSMAYLREVLGIERDDAHRALADCFDEMAVLNAELASGVAVSYGILEG